MKLKSALPLMAFAAMAVGHNAHASDGQDRDWADTLRQDATAIHAALQDSHPGPYDPLNPDFRRQLDEGLNTALARASQTSSMDGWWWAIRGYVASFDDAHVFASLKVTSAYERRWPGFLTAYQGDDIVVTTTQAGADMPPAGSKLVSCDGVPAEALASQRLGQFRGRWFLKAQRQRFGDLLFIDEGNPFAPLPAQCDFEVDGQSRAYALQWRVGGDELQQAQTAAAAVPATKAHLTRLDDGGFWIATPTFDANPQSASFGSLNAVLDGMAARQDELRSAPYVVFDLRGNRGGSSSWSQRMARTLWGEAWLEHHAPKSSQAVDWRASTANHAYLGEIHDILKGQAPDEVIAFLDEARVGMGEAIARGDAYWTETFESEAAQSPAPSTSPVSSKVFILTDYMCVSACLDAVDVWKAAGGIQIGTETSADTLYMEIRETELPSGLSGLSIPIKVYRGRERGHNQPHTPDHPLPLETLDDAALKAAIRQLAAN
ncbi:S41 family peptidase [uncultured Brevundimonas sp.]|uniref:S41 family peptidase n=1 Tax=uncultured Brevundimonas sp. TaxID=213418 RepID=UPI00262FEE64|nr:S41 family peptidase [uncultured Brevundimonas sp.]